MREQYYFSVHPSARASLSVHLSVTLSPAKPQGGIFQTCYITSPHGKCVQEQQYFPCVCAYVLPLCVRASVCSSRYLPRNCLAEIYQTCYITFLHGKDAQEHNFSVRSSVHLSVTLLPPKPLGGIEQNLLHHFPL